METPEIFPKTEFTENLIRKELSQSCTKSLRTGSFFAVPNFARSQQISNRYHNQQCRRRNSVEWISYKCKPLNWGKLYCRGT